jgi:electron transfer flavoprotein alpha subunit
MSNEIWVFAEHRDGKLLSAPLELLGEAQRLAKKSGYTVAAVLPSTSGKAFQQELFNHGAAKIYNIEDPKLAEYQNDYYAKVIADLILKEKPEIVLYGATTIGRSVAPTIAIMVHTGLTADCTEFDFDAEKKLLLQTRPAFGGNIMATISCPNHRPQMATARPNVFKKNKLGDNAKGEVIDIKPDLSGVKERMKLKQRVHEFSEKIDLTAAQYIVSGGRGIGKPESFEMIRELAHLLDGAVGASRATVDAGWIPHYHQVGQTGRTVCPVVYIACGISGAIQHLAGMQSSDVIVAVNKDPGAPIFGVADYGLVGDLHEIVPVFIQELKTLRGK